MRYGPCDNWILVLKSVSLSKRTNSTVLTTIQLTYLFVDISPVAHCPRPRRLARNRDSRRITSKSRNMVAHPTNRHTLVQESQIPARQLRRSGEPKDVHSEVKRDHDDILRLSKVLAPVERCIAGARGKPAAVDPEEHRLQARCCWRCIACEIAGRLVQGSAGI